MVLAHLSIRFDIRNVMVSFIQPSGRCGLGTSGFSNGWLDVPESKVLQWYNTRSVSPTCLSLLRPCDNKILATCCAPCSEYRSVNPIPPRSCGPYVTAVGMLRWNPHALRRTGVAAAWTLFSACLGRAVTGRE